MTDTRLKEIESRAAKATPAPWEIHVGYDRFSSNPGCYGAYLELNSETNVLVSALSDGTKQFIAHSRSDIPYLLAELARRDEMLAVAKEALESLEARLDMIDCEYAPPGSIKCILALKELRKLGVG